MLQTLSVRRLALIDELLLEPGSGFNVLTGETGAGKSMIVGALGLVLGGRARPEMVRAGAKEAEVEALFDVRAGSRAFAKLEAAGVPVDGELVIRRVVQAGGRSRAYLNGRLSTATQLAELGPELCDIASQHESVSLTDPATHLDYLDAFGQLGGLRREVGELVDHLVEIADEMARVRAAESQRAEREDLIAFQLRELEDLGVELGEETRLESERARLRHAGRLGDVTARAYAALYDAEGAVSDILGGIERELTQAGELDSSLLGFARSIESARAEIVEVARELGRYAEGAEANPTRLAEVEERLFRIEKLLRRHGPTTRELLDHRVGLEQELETMTQAQGKLEALEDDRRRRFDKAVARARRLSQRRRTSAEGLAEAIGRELAGLGMGRARVVIDVAPVEGGQREELRVDGARLTRTGLDRVEFLIAPNPGEEPRPLRRIASGGELSRALLALKRVLAENGPAGLYVFDEVDTGVGGAIAEVIGRAMADVATHRQVICITHLPQIAAQADHHFVVGKHEAEGRTTTSIRPLDAAERVDEIARMIGGVHVGDAARRAAKELISGRA